MLRECCVSVECCVNVAWACASEDWDDYCGVVLLCNRIMIAGWHGGVCTWCNNSVAAGDEVVRRPAQDWQEEDEIREITSRHALYLNAPCARC